MPAAQQVPMPAQHRLRPASCPPGRENRVRPPPQCPGQLPRRDRRQARHPEDLTVPPPEPPARLLTAWDFAHWDRADRTLGLLLPRLTEWPPLAVRCVRINSLSWSPVTESNRRPSP